MTIKNNHKIFLKDNLLYILKWAGLFKLSKKLTQNGLRILCYHNFTRGDEGLWSPELNVKAETLKKRIKFLKKEKYTILPLRNAIDLLYKNKTPYCGTVITVDDGWASTKSIAHPIFKENNIDYTIYCSTYYMEKDTPVFNCALIYLNWKAEKNGIELEKHIPDIIKKTKKEGNEFLHRLIKFGQKELKNGQRTALLKKIISRIGFDHDEILNNRLLSYLNYTELEEMAKDNVDLQLHTHRHIFSISYDQAKKEIEDNIRSLSKVTNNNPEHFCYPSGQWHFKHFDILKKLGIASATITSPGINYSNENRFKLHRFVDGEKTSQIAFEAEISGFSEMIRSAIFAKSSFNGLRNKRPDLMPIKT